MLPVGIDGLSARLEIIDLAEHSLDLQYYIFRSDVSGHLIAAALLRAADRGVQIRILVDDGETVPGDETLFALSAHPHIAICVFNPFDYRGHAQVLRGLDLLLHKSRLDYRMHNKLLVADNAVVMIGGRNIGDQYFQIDPNSQFGDDDVLATGPIVQQLSNVFQEFWTSVHAVPVDAIDRIHTTQQALSQFRTSLDPRPNLSEFQRGVHDRVESGEPLAGMGAGAMPLVWAHSTLTYDSPDKHRVEAGAEPGSLQSEFVESQLRDINTQLLMITPYFVPTHGELALLQQLRERHVDVQLLTNSLEAAPDVAAHAGYTRYRKSLLISGIHIYEIRARPGNARGSGQSKALSERGNFALHAKLYVFDRESLLVGSMNFDQRSKRLNTEIGLIINSKELANGAATRFAELTQPSNAYTLELENGGTNKTARLVWKSEVDGQPVNSTVEPSRSRWQKIKMKLLLLLPLDKEL
jgi:putative cardiolipin synthase